MKKEEKEKIRKLGSYKTFVVFFYLYMIILNIIWFMICLPWSLFTLKWRYSAERFSGYIFELHFKKALEKKNAKVKEYNDKPKT